jgi:hypothetical protein
MKTLDERVFDETRRPDELAQGGYITRAEPIIFIGDSDHLTDAA